MKRAYFPFGFVSSNALSSVLGNDLAPVAVAAVRAVLIGNHAFQIAHQQIVFGDQFVALSTRVTDAGNLIVDLELGVPGLANRIVTERELRQAAEESRVKAGLARARNRRLGR